jgi:prepilin-type N-terminal cleavage/methylation domain-containing protein
MIGNEVIKHETHNIRQKANERGFTLIELLVASVLFVIVISIGFSMYVSITRIQQTNLKSQRVLTESRFWIETLAEDLQGGKIDYAKGPFTMPDAEDLYIVSRVGESIRYYVNNSNAFARSVNGGAEEVLTSAEIQVTDLVFYLDPLIESDTNTPLVTIRWQARDLSQSDPVETNIQTTIALRNY